MIATHNIKVNGKWYKAGEEIEEPKKAEEQTEEPEALVEAATEEPKAEPKPRTTSSRRKKISE